MLEYVPEALKTEVLCLAAVQQAGGALDYVPEALKTDASTFDSIGLAAVLQDESAWEYIPEELQDSVYAAYTNAFSTEALCLAAVQKDGNMLKHVPDRLKTEAVCIEAMKHSVCSSYNRIIESNWTPTPYTYHPLKEIPDALKTEAVCIEAVQKDSRALEFVPEILRGKVKAAVKN